MSGDPNRVWFTVEVGPISRDHGHVEVNDFLLEDDIEPAEVHALRVGDRLAIRDEGGNVIPCELMHMADEPIPGGGTVRYYELRFR